MPENAFYCLASRPSACCSRAARSLGDTHSVRAASPASSAPCQAAGAPASPPRRPEDGKSACRSSAVAGRPSSARRLRRCRGGVLAVRTCARASCVHISCMHRQGGRGLRRGRACSACVLHRTMMPSRSRGSTHQQPHKPPLGRSLERHLYRGKRSAKGCVSTLDPRRAAAPRRQIRCMAAL